MPAKNPKEWYKLYRKRHPKEVKARDSAKNAAEKIPLEKQCLFCGSNKNLQRHHPDYDEPLFFVTVCRECHEYMATTKLS